MFVKQAIVALTEEAQIIDSLSHPSQFAERESHIAESDRLIDFIAAELPFAIAGLIVLLAAKGDTKQMLEALNVKHVVRDTNEEQVFLFDCGHEARVTKRDEVFVIDTHDCEYIADTAEQASAALDFPLIGENNA